MGLRLPSDVRRAIDDHVRLLVAWNASINLTAIREPAAIAVRHVADSLAGLRSFEAHGVDRFLDLGSGGGYPAIPLAIARRADDLVMVESVGKKARFLETALDVVRPTVPEAAAWSVVADRAESLARDPRHRGRWPAVTARAVASLAELVELALPLLQPGGSLIAWKAGDPADEAGLGAEIAAADRGLGVIGGGPIAVAAPLSALDAERTGALDAIADHRLVMVGRGRRPIDDRWPRDPAVRRRDPW